MATCTYKFRNGNICGAKIKKQSGTLCTKHKYQMSRKKPSKPKEIIITTPIVKPTPLKKDVRNRVRELIMEEIDGIKPKIIPEKDPLDELDEQKVEKIVESPIVVIEHEEIVENNDGNDIIDLSKDVELPKFFFKSQTTEYAEHLLTKLENKIDQPGIKNKNEAFSIITKLLEINVINQVEYEKLLSCLN